VLLESSICSSSDPKETSHLMCLVRASFGTKKSLYIKGRIRLVPCKRKRRRKRVRSLVDLEINKQTIRYASFVEAKERLKSAI